MTNAIAPPPESSKTGHKGALAVGAAFLAAAATTPTTVR